MKKFFAKIKNKIFTTLWNVIDSLIDLKICKMSLVKYVPSVFRDDENGVGLTGSQSTHYCVLKRIFARVEVNHNDRFLDVGCGKGRVLAHAIRENLYEDINGVEINEKSAGFALKWTEKYDNVNVIVGDAFELDFDKYDVLFLGRPFLPKTFAEFLEKLEGDLTHPITFIYWCDQQSGYMLKGREGWKKLWRERVFKVCKIPVSHSPQSFSVWTYTPREK